VQAVSARRLFIVGYGARITCLSYLRTIARSFSTNSGHSQLYCTITPPSSRLCTCSSFEIGRVWIPQGAMYGRCGPEVGGSELYAVCGSEAAWMCSLPRSANFSPGRSAEARDANHPIAAAATAG